MDAALGHAYAVTGRFDLGAPHPVQSFFGQYITTYVGMLYAVPANKNSGLLKGRLRARRSALLAKC
jgi:hypothetical protein